MQVQSDKIAEIVDEVDGDDAQDADAAQGVQLPDAVAFFMADSRNLGSLPRRRQAAG